LEGDQTCGRMQFTGIIKDSQTDKRAVALTL
jgi:hypothetical protein